MKCKVSWNIQFLIQKLEKGWVYGPYKVHRQDVLLERERARFPETLEQIHQAQEQIKHQKWLGEQLTLKADQIKAQLAALPRRPRRWMWKRVRG